VRGTQYFLPAQFQPLVTGLGMILLLMLFPGGLGQITFGIRDKYLRFVANRRGVLVPSLVADKRVVDDEIVEAVLDEHAPILEGEHLVGAEA
jgi:hypothetical protein